MKRRQVSHAHIEEVRRKILSAAKALGIEQGYKKTTIRQIVEKSGVLTGSIYYLYKNKADIFQAMVLALFKQCVRIMDEDFHEESPAFRYVLMCTVELKAVERNELVRESYYEGYTQTGIFEKMVEHAASITRQLFTAEHPEFTEQDYYERTLLIKGMMRSCIAKYYFSVEPDTKSCVELTLRTALGLFGVLPAEIDAALERLDRMEPEVCQMVERMLNRQRQEDI